MILEEGDGSDLAGIVRSHRDPARFVIHMTNGVVTRVAGPTVYIVSIVAAVETIFAEIESDILAADVGA